VAPAVDLALVARACGYPEVRRVASAAELREELRARRAGPVFLHVRTQPRASRKLPRPTESPAQVAERFERWLEAHP
jgi:phosphonopyruvate decarboxylase